MINQLTPIAYEFVGNRGSYIICAPRGSSGLWLIEHPTQTDSIGRPYVLTKYGWEAQKSPGYMPEYQYYIESLVFYRTPDLAVKAIIDLEKELNFRDRCDAAYKELSKLPGWENKPITERRMLFQEIQAKERLKE